jgi:cell division protein FtsQ
MRFLKPKRSDAPSKRRSQRRRRVVPWWRTRLALVGGYGLGLLAIAGSAWWAWTAEVPQRLARQSLAAMIASSADFGLIVNEVFVIGRHETPREHLLEALGAERGSAILGLDIAAARARLLALPWIAEASVERLLPDMIVVRITERKPLALWQNHAQFALIDTDGEVIQRNDLDRFNDLLIVVGDDAPREAEALVDILERQPELRDQVKAAIRIGGRRWNLRLANGIDVRLPEENPDGAWARLAEEERTHQVLQRDIQVLDLRFDDQLIVQRNTQPEDQRNTQPEDRKAKKG